MVIIHALTGYHSRKVVEFGALRIAGTGFDLSRA